MTKATLRCMALALVSLFAMTPTAVGSPLDIPAAVPQEFRALVRARLHAPKPHFASESRFDLETRQGYEVSVVGVGNIVALEVTRDQPGAPGQDQPLLGQAVTAYVTRGTVTPSRIEATFGKLGRVAVRFHPSGAIAKSKPRGRCKGADHFTSRFGVFVGSVRFSGENHYLSVRAHRARGRIRGPLQLRCTHSRFHPPVKRASRTVRSSPSFPFTLLAAGWRQAVASTEFTAFRIGDTTLFLAVSEQSMGSMAEVRYALAISSSKLFAINDALTSATIKPPAPFDGKGVYSAAPDGTKSWAGSLTVAFPGARHLSLAGPAFKAKLASGF